MDINFDELREQIRREHEEAEKDMDRVKQEAAERVTARHNEANGAKST